MIGVAVIGLFGYHNIRARQQRLLGVIRHQIAQEEVNQQAQAEVAALFLQIEEYRQRLPPGPDPSWLVREAVAISEQAGISLAVINQEPPTPIPPHLTRVAVNLQFRASYHRLGEFLDLLERSRRFIRVERVDFAPPTGQDDTGEGAVRLVLSTVFVPEPMAALAGG
jgi:hypothetical protein